METTRGERIRVAFVAPSCVLDTGSGAAISARTVLELLVAEGFECASFTPAVFDGAEEFPLASLINAAAATPEHVGNTVQIRHDGVTHLIFRTTSSVGTKISMEERQTFIRETFMRVKEFRPHVILSYASGAYGLALFEQLRRISARLVLYCLNAGINQPELFAGCDAVVCPSNAMIALCKERFGITASLLRDPIAPRNAADPAETLAVRAPESRGQGFVTFINPAPTKGATLVLALAQKALQERPDLTFLIVESRVRKSFWDTETKFLKRDLPNVWWVPNQPDLRRIYARTAALVFPSFWFEVSGRSIAEAQLGGIPVLASRRGGIAEQLNGGGFLLDLPDQLDGKTLALPDDAVVGSWLDLLCRLFDDEAFYRQASASALEAAQPFQWRRQRGEIAALFHELASA